MSWVLRSAEIANTGNSQNCPKCSPRKGKQTSSHPGPKEPPVGRVISAHLSAYSLPAISISLLCESIYLADFLTSFLFLCEWVFCPHSCLCTVCNVCSIRRVENRCQVRLPGQVIAMTKYSPSMHKAPGSSLNITKYPANLYLWVARQDWKMGLCLVVALGQLVSYQLRIWRKRLFLPHLTLSALIRQLSGCVITVLYKNKTLASTSLRTLARVLFLCTCIIPRLPPGLTRLSKENNPKQKG